MTATLLTGDCLEVMPTLDAASIDAIVTDPPYGLGFMGKAWDHGVPGVDFWREALRVAKPGAHLVAFGGTRTYHRLTCAIEDAGWEIRDCLSWLYGSGFPKSLDVSKAIDKAAGAAGTYGAPKSAAHAGWVERGRMRGDNGHEGLQRPWMDDPEAVDRAARTYQPASDAARNWQGWGTALKPAWEPIILARKPLVGTVAANVAAHGTGALNIDGCRVGTVEYPQDEWTQKGASRTAYGRHRPSDTPVPSGRWPANLTLDEDAAAMLDEQAPRTGASAPVRGTEPSTPAKHTYGTFARGGGAFHDDGFGGASRFFYCAKASRSERNAGTQNPGALQSANTDRTSENHHPTVKPLALMRWLCRLVTPAGGTVLDPFTGSGSTGCAAVAEGFAFVGIEREVEYVEIARRRIAHHTPGQIELIGGAP